MIHFIILFLIITVFISEVHYIVFRNPKVNKFSILLLLIIVSFQVIDIVLIFSLLFTSFLILKFIILVFSFFSIYFRIKYPHKTFEKPNLKYLTSLSLLFFSALFLFYFSCKYIFIY